jgi:hypothetical protein
MATVYGMLGQSSPAATTLTAAYTVPASKHATVRVIASNRGAADTFRIAVSPDGAGIADAHYVAYDQAIGANDSLASAPFTAGSTDVVRVYSTAGSMSFSVTGIEEDD